jgi:hypothetical protein
MKTKKEEIKKEIITEGIKGFNKNLQCYNDFQYEIGKEYETKEVPIRCTKNGFHFCENPLDVFRYYSPNFSRYTKVEGLGEPSKDNEDTKVAVSKIRIGAEISLHNLIESGIKFIFERTTLTNGKTNTENNLQASNSGYSGAAFSIGDYSSSETTKEDTFAVALGIKNKVKGIIGSWLTIAEWKEDKNGKWVVESVKSVKVDGKKLKADTFYKLENGKFIKA